MQGITADGAEVVAEEHGDRLKVVALLPRQIDTESDGTEVWEGSTS